MVVTAFVSGSLSTSRFGFSSYVAYRPQNLTPHSPHLTWRRSRNTRRVAPAAVLDTERATADPDDQLSASRLRQDHLNAYFDADESMYQTSLASVFRLAMRNFTVELGELLTGVRRVVGLEPPVSFTPPECLRFELDSKAVDERERVRYQMAGGLPASWIVRSVYRLTCVGLDALFDGRPISRFWLLETVARMPYFAYTSCLHLLSTLGWYRSPTLMNMHHAEELNEAYHLAVMESLGGDKRWSDRFLAFHASLVYYWCLVLLFFISPAESYRFSQLLEGHAVDTYAEFVETNRELLRSLPAPDVAHEYYEHFVYYFHEFQLSEGEERKGEIRRPKIDSLYDVFENVLLDELEHAKTMAACINYIEKGAEIWYNGKLISASSRQQNAMSGNKRKEFWEKWSSITTDEKN